MPFDEWEWGPWGALAEERILRRKIILEAFKQRHQAMQAGLNNVDIAIAKPVSLKEELDEEGIMLNNFKIGCDPEFMLLDAAGKTVNANQFFPHDGPIGYDHNGRVAEFRPAPTFGILPIITKIKDLVKSKQIQQVNRRLRAGAVCNADALGGHVHFGFNCFEQKPIEGYSILTGGGKFNARGAQVTKALDALTQTLEKLDILPAHECSARRSGGQGYGRYGDVRDCNGHMEYRTMASWLYDPKVAFLCLTAAKLAAVDPEGTLVALKGCGDFNTFEKWLNQYKGKDVNATRASEKLLDKGLKYIQVDPEVDFRESWERLGL
jgi:Phage phiEco32-like COOH.NH2 ligase-type 2